ncbi:FAD-binding protein [Kaistia adipata]|uniref:FAD-binding protein n=1 Tax=Kaistia adipata TaxID=166954 RepID=UPI0003FED232|nr:FAD-binding protein [Kaistia adipata]
MALFDPEARPALAERVTTDLLVIGSGASGLTAALAGLLAGLRVIVVDSAPAFGGTTARSSGTSWVPDNRMMRAAGMEGDREQAELYLDTLIGPRGPRAPWEAFLDAAPEMQADLEDRAEIVFRPYRGAPDYRANLPGAGQGWRPLEPVEFDGRLLGGYFPLIANPVPEFTVFNGMMVTRAEAGRLVHAEKSLSAMVLGARLTLRYLADRLSGHRRGTRLVMGNALVARLVHAVLARGGLLYENVLVGGLRMEGGRVVGAEVTRNGVSARIDATRGVVLAGGGFPGNEDWRRRELPSPAPEHTPASPYACAGTIGLATDVGAALGPKLSDAGLWFPSSLRTRADGSLAVYPHIALDRAKPGSIIVNSAGRRFANEALSYHDFVRAMYAAHRETSAIPAWLIGDRSFLRRYGMGIVRPRTPALGGYVREGYLKYGRTVAELARAINVPGAELAETIRRFNVFASTGTDADFARGETSYQRSNGDAAHGPNPCLGPVGERELYAVALYPTPLGTSRGLSASVDGEVRDGQGGPIPGLYVCGNDMQSCFSGEYPGAGAQIGAGMTFAWRAVRHITRNP